jgi:hypothetical protein
MFRKGKNGLLNCWNGERVRVPVPVYSVEIGPVMIWKVVAVPVSENDLKVTGIFGS